ALAGGPGAAVAWSHHLPAADQRRGRGGGAGAAVHGGSPLGASVGARRGESGWRHHHLLPLAAPGAVRPAGDSRYKASDSWSIRGRVAGPAVRQPPGPQATASLFSIWWHLSHAGVSRVQDLVALVP